MKNILTTLFLISIVCYVSANQEMESETMTEAEMRTSLIEEMRKVHPVRSSSRTSAVLPNEIVDRANLFFRSMDVNHDKMIDSEDVQQSVHRLGEHAPGISADEFASFISIADKNGDNKLSNEEFVNALSQGLNDVTMIETDATANRRGFLSSVGNFVKGAIGNLGSKIGSAFRKITGKVDTSNDACVICQYVLERCETNVKQSGVIPALTGAQSGPTIFLEMDQQQNPFDYAAASIIGSTRLSTRYQRQLERQKYNEIYRVVDISLDDVCESGMPTAFYGYCKQIYQAQSDIVDGLRYQYRPTDICFRVGMCAKNSYITKGVHSRYKGAK